MRLALAGKCGWREASGLTVAAALAYSPSSPAKANAPKPALDFCSISRRVNGGASYPLQTEPPLFIQKIGPAEARLPRQKSDPKNQSKNMNSLDENNTRARLSQACSVALGGSASAWPSAWLTN